MATFTVRDPTTFRVGQESKRALHRSSIYIGSSKSEIRKVHVISRDEENNYTARIVTTNLPEGIERVYLETLVNACDIMKEARLDGCVDTPIIVDTTDSKVTIRNGGKLLPITKNLETGRYIPEEAFGVLGTSSNYNKYINTTAYDETINEDKSILGRNGVGAKLANIMSKKFDLLIAIGTQRYAQYWSDNMSEVSSPNIYDTKDIDNFVQISYELDFLRFEGRTEYTKSDIDLFMSHCIDMACISRLKFIFNGEEIEPISFQEYVNIIYGEVPVIYGYIWKNYNPKVTYNVDELIKEGHPPLLEYACIDTPDKGKFISFVNGSVTRDGGTHVDAVYKAVGAIYLADINKQHNRTKLSLKYIKKHLSVIVTANVNGIPEMNGNTKTKLTSPSFSVQLSDENKVVLDTFSLKNMLEAELEAGTIRALGVKTSRHVGLKVPKLIDAIYASKPKNKRPDDKPVILIITEGDSAALFADVYIGDDRKHYGILPVRGKTINARKHTTEKVLKNKEYQSIVASMGLNEGMDYNDDEVFNSTRYDKILIAADQDSDGEHIKGLLITLLHKRFPGIVERGLCIEVLISFIMVVTKGKQRLGFFHPKDYENWLENNPNPKTKGWKTKYLKGLGSYNDADIRHDREFFRCVPVDFDETADKSLELAFGASTADARKHWILDYDGHAPRIEDTLPITDFVNNHLVRHAVDNIERTIPMFDGMKQSIRKVMSACFDKWKMKNGQICKTVGLMGNVFENMDYHHGDDSLISSICRMVCQYPGSNNLPLLLGDGQFGNRKGFKSAKPRYTSVGSQSWWPHMFPKSDLDITPRLASDGVNIEYIYIPQVLPIILINGARSLATGWRSFIPSANPKHIATYYKKKLMGENPSMFKPWYRGYHGKVRTVLTSRIKSILAEYADIKHVPEIPTEKLDEYLPSELNKEILLGNAVDGTDATHSMIIDGCFDVSDNGMVTITEIPVGIEINRYILWLKELLEEKSIKYFEDNSSDENGINIVIKGFPNPTLKTLGLQKIRKLSDLTLLNEQGKPVTFSNIKELADVWYKWRLAQYPIKKAHMVKEYTQNIKSISNRVKYINLVLKGTIKVNNRPKDEWKLDIEKHDVEYDLVKHMKISQLTKEKVEQLNMEFNTMQEKLDILTAKTPEELWLEDIDNLLPHLK